MQVLRPPPPKGRYGDIACFLIARITNVSHKLSEKTSHVIRIEQTLRNDLSVTSISQSLAMRVTTYYAFEIGMHCTVISLTDVIEKFVRTFKTPCVPDIRINGFYLLYFVRRFRLPSVAITSIFLNACQVNLFPSFFLSSFLVYIHPLVHSPSLHH